MWRTLNTFQIPVKGIDWESWRTWHRFYACCSSRSRPPSAGWRSLSSCPRRRRTASRAAGRGRWAACPPSAHTPGSCGPCTAAAANSNSPASHCIALHRTASHIITLHHTASHCFTLHQRLHTASTASHCINSITLHHTASTASHSITLHHTASHCITHCITLHQRHSGSET